MPDPPSQIDDPMATPQGQSTIEVRELSKTYTSGLIFRKKFPALHRVSFDVGRGEVFGLLGPNGAGKTTFLKILLGIISKSGGDASLLGFAAGNRRGRRNVGFLPEQLRFPRHLTGYTALEYYGNLHNKTSANVRDKRDELLDFVGLAGRGKDRVTKYSKGMLQRLGLAQALLNEPQLLVMDEPTDGLDPGARAEMRTLMQELRNRGVTIFLNSHLLQEVELVCD
ncbi:MAG: ABC transporter ATP-binding protein, partial [Pirellulaceae bacterium]